VRIRRLVEGGWTGADRWAAAEGKEQAFCARVLVAAGFGEEEARQAIAIGVQAAIRVEAAFGNDLHIMLRRAGEQLREELVALLTGIGVNKPQIEKGATLWLQNVANLPLLVAHDEHVRSFCKRFGIGPDELTAWCDRQGLNVAVLDDLLAADHLTRNYLKSVAAKPSGSRPSPKRKRA
jgi:hypothetical protein